MKEWRRVTKKCPCVVCGKPDWCTVSERGSCCMRIASGKQLGNGGYLHKSAEALPLPEKQPERTRMVLWDIIVKHLTPRHGEVHRAARELGVSAESLQTLDCGWDGEALCFPMRNAFGDIVGIRRRFPSGKKLSWPGGKEGLFIPSTNAFSGNMSLNGRVLICEGPTDTAAMLTIGQYAIGRPSCVGGVEWLRIVCEGLETIVVADNDPVGKRGAESLAVSLGCKWISPPVGHKDVRAWLHAGMDKDQIEERINLHGKHHSAEV